MLLLLICLLYVARVATTWGPAPVEPGNPNNALVGPQVPRAVGARMDLATCGFDLLQPADAG
jgi:hypothetical protein